MCNLSSYLLVDLYSHVPIFIVSVILAVIVFSIDRKSAINRNLFYFILFFCFWIAVDFLQWLSLPYDTNLFFVRVSYLETIGVVFFLFFVYEFTRNNLSNKKKTLLLLPCLPLFFFLFSDYNASIVRDSRCNSVIGPMYWYVYLLLFFYTVWAIKLLISFRKGQKNEKEKRQIDLIMRGIFYGVSWIVIMIVLSSFSVAQSLSFGDDISMFAPFGMVIFIGFLVYAITKYQFLQIKLIAAQILTYAIWILIGSQYFFAVGVIMYLLISFTLLLSILFGIFLIKSVKKDIERKEELQLMADKLATANDALRKLDNAKTEFISIASHQLRTPITAIKGFASLLLEGAYGELTDGVHGALEKVYSSSERLVMLIEDLLNVSRIESGRMIFAFEKASVEKLIKELYDNFILIAKTKKFYLDLKLPETPLPEPVMDYSKIRELVSNFIDNGLKYTEKGGVTIKAELRDEGVVVDESGFVIEGKKSEFGRVIRITVSDTGIGIPREEIPYLFKKFSRGKDVSRLHVGGTGLGLYVGKAIAENHHGAVWIESEGAGKGSRFIIEIPVEHVA